MCVHVLNNSSMYIYITFIQPENKGCVELYCMEKKLVPQYFYNGTCNIDQSNIYISRTNNTLETSMCKAQKHHVMMYKIKYFVNAIIYLLLLNIFLNLYMLLFLLEHGYFIYSLHLYEIFNMELNNTEKTRRHDHYI